MYIVHTPNNQLQVLVHDQKTLSVYWLGEHHLLYYKWQPCSDCLLYSQSSVIQDGNYIIKEPHADSSIALSMYRTHQFGMLWWYISVLPSTCRYINAIQMKWLFNIERINGNISRNNIDRAVKRDIAMYKRKVDTFTYIDIKEEREMASDCYT